MKQNYIQKALVGIALAVMFFAFNCQNVLGCKNGVKKTFHVNSYVNTGIQVNRDDTITIAASGEVTFGLVAGTGGPGGVDWCYNEEYDEETGERLCDDSNPYNYFQDMYHGSLIGRINNANDQGEWFYVGVGGKTIAGTSGILEFNVNDNEPKNNVGKFEVEVEVCKAN